MKFSVALVLFVCLAAAFGEKPAATSRVKKDASPEDQTQENCIYVDSSDGRKQVVCGEAAPKNQEDSSYEKSAENPTGKAAEPKTISLLLAKKLQKPPQIYFINQQPQQHYIERPHAEPVYQPAYQPVIQPVYQPIYVPKPVYVQKPVYVPQPIYQRPIYHQQPIYHQPIVQQPIHEQYDECDLGKSAEENGMIPFSRTVETTHFINDRPVSRTVKSQPIGMGGYGQQYSTPYSTPYTNMGGMNGMGNMYGANGMGNMYGANGMYGSYGVRRPLYRDADDVIDAPSSVEGYLPNSAIANMQNYNWIDSQNFGKSILGLNQPAMRSADPTLSPFGYPIPNQPLQPWQLTQMRAAEENFDGQQMSGFSQIPQFVNLPAQQQENSFVMRSSEPMRFALPNPGAPESIQSYSLTPFNGGNNQMMYSGMMPLQAQRAVEITESQTDNIANQLEKLSNEDMTKLFKKLSSDLKKTTNKDSSSVPLLSRRESEDIKSKSTDQLKPTNIDGGKN